MATEKSLERKTRTMKDTIDNSYVYTAVHTHCIHIHQLCRATEAIQQKYILYYKEEFPGGLTFLCRA